MNELDKVVNRLKDQLGAEPPLVKTPRVERLSFDLHAQHLGYLDMKCPLCHGTTRIALCADKYARWHAGTHVQDVWPDVSPGDRETLITGIHDACFDEAFGDDEGEDDDDKRS